MRLLIVGAGATGGYFGGRLAEAGRDVTFLVRPGRAAALRAGGLRIESPHGDAVVRPEVVTAAELAGPYDAVVLAVKSYALEAALADLGPAVGPGTVIVPLLNGMRHLDAVAEHFGPDPVLGGVCVVAATLRGDGRVVQLSGMQSLSYGELDGRPSSRLDALDTALQGAGFEARASAVIVQEMWEKWVFLASLGATTCLLGGTIGDVVAAPGGKEIVTRILAECAAVAAAAGFPPRQAALAYATGVMTEPGSATASSMFRDRQEGNRVEADHILGDLLRRAGQAGVDAPLLGAAYASLSIYEHRRGEP